MSKKIESFGPLETVPSEPPTMRQSSKKERRGVEKADLLIGGDLYNEIVKLNPEEYLPIPVGIGGEHVVFEAFLKKKKKTSVPLEEGADTIERLMDVVVKINFDQTRRVLPDLLSGDVRSKERAIRLMTQEIERKREGLTELRRYFGRDAIPAQRMMVGEVPVTPKLVKAFAPRLDVPDETIPSTLPVWINVQRRLELKEGKQAEHISLNGSYPEDRYWRHGIEDPKEGDRLYDLAHDVLVGRKTDVDSEEAEAAILKIYPQLQPVAWGAKHDPAFKAKLQDTVERLIQYSRETGVALDLVGNNNMLLEKRNGEWQLKMPDVLPLGNARFEELSAAHEQLMKRKMRNEEMSLTPEETSHAFNPLNTLRVINALAILSGYPGRLTRKSLKEVPASVWRVGIAPLLAPAA